VAAKVLPQLAFTGGQAGPPAPPSMATAPSRQRFESFHGPEHVFVVSWLGIPLRGSVSFRAGRGFFPMRRSGPNDGMVLLADTIFPGGVTLAELGSDHFLMDRHLDITTVALVITVIRWLENPGGAVSQVP